MTDKIPCERAYCADPFCDRPHLQECEGCGAIVAELYFVSACDEYVGYHERREVCETCLSRSRNTCGSC